MKVTTTIVPYNGQGLPARCIEDGAIRITVRQRLYRDRVNRVALERKLVPTLEKDAPAEQRDEQTARINFCYLASQSCIEGVPWQLVTRETPTQEAEAAFQAFLDLPDALVQTWLAALNALEATNDDPVSKRPEALTEEEQADPNLGAPGATSKTKSAGR